MNLKQLEHLLAVAQTGSFSKAAELLHLTQPALSRSIRLLEDTLQARLIDRMGRKNELTALGEAVATRARQLLLEAEEIQRTVGLLKSGALGPVNIGLGSGPAAVLTNPLLRYVAHHHPDFGLCHLPPLSSHSQFLIFNFNSDSKLHHTKNVKGHL